MKTTVASGMFLGAFLAFVFFAFFLGLFLRIKARRGQVERTWVGIDASYYLIYAVMSLCGAVFMASFSLMTHFSDSLAVVAVTNRLYVVSSVLVLTLFIHFFKVFYSLKGKVDLFLAYGLDAFFALLAILDTDMFLANELFQPRLPYAGLRYGPLFFAWGAWLFIQCAYCLWILISIFRGGKRYDRRTRGGALLHAVPVALLLAAGILDDLSLFGVLDFIPLSWLAGMAIMASIGGNLIRQIDRLNAEAIELYHQVIHDSLTGAYSRGYFDLKLAERLSCDRPDCGRTYLVMLDVDDFKGINDTYGHTSGDMVLKRIALVMRENLRPKDLVARIGGDEFAVIVQDFSSEDHLVNLIDRVRISLNAIKVSDDPSAPGISCSFGITYFDMGLAPKRLRPEAVIDAADKALYRSKYGGKNKVSFSRLERDGAVAIA